MMLDPFPPLRILIADDSLADFSLVRLALEENNIAADLIHLKDGAEVIHYFQNFPHPKEEEYVLPSLLLLDLELPRIHGLEVLKKIRESSSLPGRIPVIILSSATAEKDIGECYRFGANSFIQKPADFIGFVSLINGIVRFWAQA